MYIRPFFDIVESVLYLKIRKSPAGLGCILFNTLVLYLLFGGLRLSFKKPSRP